MVPEYPANSEKSKQQLKHDIPAPIADAQAQVKKKKDNKYLRLIFAQDFKDVKNDLMTQYVEPKIKELFWGFVQAQIDFVTNGLRMMVFKDYKPVNRSSTPAERYSYNNMYNSSSRPAPTMTTELNYDEFTYGNDQKAKDILAGMRDILDKYKEVSVLDLYGLSGVSTSNYTLQDYGWRNLDFAEVQQVFTEDGLRYTINLPKAKPLK